MRGSGRFGKYGDLKRREKIRETRLLQRGRPKAGAGEQLSKPARSGKRDDGRFNKS